MEQHILISTEEGATNLRWRLKMVEEVGKILADGKKRPTKIFPLFFFYEIYSFKSNAKERTKKSWKLLKLWHKNHFETPS
jgi:hypothetical protein